MEHIGIVAVDIMSELILVRTTFICSDTALGYSAFLAGVQHQPFLILHALWLEISTRVWGSDYSCIGSQVAISLFRVNARRRLILGHDVGLASKRLHCVHPWFAGTIFCAKRLNST